MTENYQICPKCGTKYHVKAGACPKCSQNGQSKTTGIECPLCHQGQMQQGQVPLIKDSIVRFFGYSIVVCVVFLLGMSVYGLIARELLLAFWFFLASIFDGILGFLIISNRPAWICPRCDHYLLRK